MNPRWVALLLAGMWLLAVVQASLVTQLPAPLGGAAVVVVAVLALAYALGPLAGAVTGVWAGLALDLVPPAAGPLGGWALLLGLAGLAMGAAVAAGQPGPFAAMALVGLGVLAVELGWWVMLWFAGATPAAPDVVVAALVGAAIGVLLAPAALPAAVAVGQRIQLGVRG